MNTDVKRSVKTLVEFDAALKEAHMLGQWRFDEALQKAKNGPKSYGVPYLWKWDVAHAKLMEACEVLPASNDARRNLSFRNPATNGGAATQTVSVGMQAVLPGEICWSHRHSIDALRFGVDGDPRLYTVVNGEKLSLATGDLVLTPAYSWHDHHNESDRVGIWLDVLNTPMMFALNQIFYEEFGEQTQPLREQESNFISARGDLVRPAWEAPPTTATAFRYPWRNVQATLRQLANAKGSPYDGVILRYVNPFTGGPTLPTLDCYIQMLHPGLETEQHRQTSSAVYYVVEGEGTTVVGDHELNWAVGDTFAVPNWLWHRHINKSNSKEAILFCVSDAPALAALGLYREEPVVSIKSESVPTVPADFVRTNLNPMIIR